MKRSTVVYWANVVLASFTMVLGISSPILKVSFYSKEASERGLSTFQSGVVLGINFFVTMIVAPLVGRFMKDGQSRKWIILGTLLSCVGSGGFGCLYLVREGSPFFILSLFFSCVSAVGDSIITPSAFALATSQATHQSNSKEFNIVSIGYNTGYLVSPVLGGVLYDQGGYPVPYWILSGCLLLVGIVHSAISLLSEEVRVTDQQQEDVSWWKVATSANVPASLIALISTGMSGTWYFSSLEPYISNVYDWGPSEAGLLYTLNGITFTVFSVFFGLLVAKGADRIVLVAIGSLILVLAFMFLAPIPPLDVIGGGSYQVAVCLAIQGIGEASIYLCAHQYMHEGLRISGISASEKATAIIGSVWAIGDSAGSFVGSLLGSFSYQRLNFPWSIFILAVVNAVTCLLIGGHYAYRRIKRSRQVEPVKPSSD